MLFNGVKVLKGGLELVGQLGIMPYVTGTVEVIKKTVPNMFVNEAQAKIGEFVIWEMATTAWNATVGYVVNEAIDTYNEVKEAIEEEQEKRKK